MNTIMIQKETNSGKNIQVEKKEVTISEVNISEVNIPKVNISEVNMSEVNKKEDNVLNIEKITELTNILKDMNKEFESMRAEGVYCDYTDIIEDQNEEIYKTLKNEYKNEINTNIEDIFENKDYLNDIMYIKECVPLYLDITYHLDNKKIDDKQIEKIIKRWLFEYKRKENIYDRLKFIEYLLYTIDVAEKVIPINYKLDEKEKNDIRVKKRILVEKLTNDQNLLDMMKQYPKINYTKDFTNYEELIIYLTFLQNMGKQDLDYTDIKLTEKEIDKLLDEL